MRPNPNLLRRLAPVSAMMIIFGSSIADHALASEWPPPARLCTVTDDVARELEGFRLKPFIWAYGVDGRWVTALITANPDDIPRLLKELIFPAEPGPGCPPQGAVLCCDQATGTFKLSTELNGKLVWAEMAETCRLEPVEDIDDDDDHGLGIKEIELPTPLWQELSDTCGFQDERINAATQDGEPRLLVEMGSQTGQLSLPAPMMGRIELRWRSPIVLAHDHPPPANCTTTDTPPACCKEEGGDRRCHKNQEHWYTKRISGNWCRREGCDCDNCKD